MTFPFEPAWLRCVVRWSRLAPMVLAATLLGSGCASLPGGIARTPSTAIAASTGTALGRIAAVSSPDPALSGFRLLPSGPFALSTRIELARRSERSLDLLYFQIQDDATGRSLLRTLRDAARRGVRVRLLLDDLHTSGQDLMLLGLAAHANVEVRLFNPFAARRGGMYLRYAASLFEFERLNHRMHNKLFVADGSMAVTGGRNIADEYFTRHPLANFIDLDVFATGVIVADLADLFDLYWNSSPAYPIGSIARSGDSPAELQARFEELTRTAPSQAAEEELVTDVLGYGPLGAELDAGRLDLIWGPAEVFADPPEPTNEVEALATRRSEQSARVRRSVLEHMRDSRREIALTSPYLIPGRTGMELIREVRSRGVKVSILTNSLASTDQPLVHSGYRRYRHELLGMGVDLYELSPVKAGRKSRRILFGASVGGLHTKAIVFDREEVFIGSMNFDPRSNHYNTEMGLFVHSPALAREAFHLAHLAQLQAAHRLRLTAAGGIEWLTPADADDEVHTDEPEAGFWVRVLLELLAPLAPESLL